MACLMNVLLVSVLICRLVKDAAAQGAQVQQVDNAEQFALLCRIYNVAKNPPINHVDLQDTHKIVEEIDAINASLAEEKVLDETDKVGNSTDSQVKPTITREAAVAQALLKSITQKAHTILDEIRKVNVTRDIEKVKFDFAYVIFGEGMNESQLCEGALKDVVDRAAACGVTGLTNKGASAGKNLVVDFFCLCTQRTDSNGIENVCSVKVGGRGKDDYHGWRDSKGPSGLSSMWASVKKGCENLLHTHPRTTKEGYEVIEDFLTHLKTGGVYRWGTTKNNGVEGSGRKKGMLGTAVGAKEGNHESGLVCDGKKGEKGGSPSSRSGGENVVKPGGVCVYYGSEPQWEENISWLKKLKTALASVDTLNNQTATIQRSIEKLHMLLYRAEKIYETTKVITEIQRPVVFTNIQTAAKRLTAYNAAQRYYPYHFIAPWVLLLL